MTDKLKKLTVRISAKTHRAAKIAVAAYETTLGDVVQKLLRLWVADPTIIETDPPEIDEDPADTLQRLMD